MGKKDIPKRIYLDTSYLIPIIKKRVTGESDEKSSIVERSMYRARDNYKIIIPQIVVGELFAKIPELMKNLTDEAHQLKVAKVVSSMIGVFEDYTGEEFIGLIPINREAIDISLKIVEYENRIKDPTDFLLVALAAVDQHSEYLLTFDDILLSKGINNFIKKLMYDGVRSNDLKIQDEL
jgi:predicted nucleic acid-binding protein